MGGSRFGLVGVTAFIFVRGSGDDGNCTCRRRRRRRHCRRRRAFDEKKQMRARNNRPNGNDFNLP